MADAIRRSHARIPCDHAVEVHHGASGRMIGTGKLVNLSLSGAFLSFSGNLQRGTPYRLRIEGPEGPVDLLCRVVREGPRAGPHAPNVRRFGMVFNLSGDQEHLLRRLLDVLRRQPPAEPETGLDRTLRNYWS